MVQIEITLKQLKSFINNLKYSSYRGLAKCEPILWEGFRSAFRVPHSQTSQISDKQELARLIRNSNHRPSPARSGPAYNQEYLKRKQRLGESMPHKFTEYGFWMGTDINMVGEGLQIKTKPGTKRGKFSAGQGDYLSFHETQRSVLKKAFLNSWQEIINTLIENYAEEAQE